MPTETKHTPGMKDFGNLNSDWCTCSVCGSRNHDTLAHNRLNNAAPELLEALKALLEATESHLAGPSVETMNQLTHHLRQARAAIRAAEGE